jgi:hypothetical protein
MRYYVLAPCALETHHVPGIVNLQVAYWYDNMHSRVMRLGIGAPQHDPLGMIDARGELPASIHAIAAVDGDCIPLP